jgi:respiratory-subunit NADH dehydrogenase subunit
MKDRSSIIQELQNRFGAATITPQTTHDDVPTLWVSRGHVRDVLRYLKTEAERPYRVLYDLTAIDERVRAHRPDQPDSDFTAVYHLFSYERNADIRIKVALQGDFPALHSIVDLWIPTAQRGDCYDRAVVRVAEMRQSLRIIEQCVNNMPAGPYKSDHPLTTPPLKERTMHDIETLITHFLSVSWGPVIPPGEAFVGIEATKGNNGYYLISDGSTMPYRVRIRTPSFPHLQMLPLISRGGMITDLLAILGSIDFVLADVDR